MLAWNPYGVFGLASGALLVALSAVVLFARPGRFQNVALAGVLLLAGLAQASAVGIRFFMPARVDAYAIRITADLMLPLIAAALLLFYSTMPGTLSRPLRPVPVRLAITASALALALAGALYPALVRNVAGRWWPEQQVWGFPGSGPLLLVFLIALTAALLLGVPTTWNAARHSIGTAERDRYRAMAWAFGTVFALLGMYVALFVVLPRATPWTLWGLVPEALRFFMNFHVVTFFSTILVVWLSYGILKHQLFDIELKLKWTIRRGTLLGAFVFAFFLVAQLAQSYLNVAYGWAFGGIAAGCLLFALRPLERLADRVAESALPGVAATPQYLGYRKLRVYEAALAEMLADGQVTAKERRALDALRVQLGVAEVEAHELERELAAKPTRA